MKPLDDFRFFAAAFSEPGQSEDGRAERKRGFKLKAYSGDRLDLGLDRPVYIDLERFECDQRKPVLYDHRPSLPIGFTTSAVVDPTEGLTVEGLWLKPVAASYEEQMTIEKVQGYMEQGYPWEVSVGARPTSCDTLEAGQKQMLNGREIEGPAYVCGARLREISVTVLGADENTFAIAAKKPEEKLMPPENAPAPEVKKNPATLAELRAAFPDDLEFVFDCAQRNLTMIEASAALVPILQKRIAEMKAAPPAKVEAAAPQNAPVMIVQAQQPVNTAGLNNPQSAPPAQIFRQIYDGHIRAGLSKPEAIRATVTQNPQLHAEFLRAAPPAPPAKQRR